MNKDFENFSLLYGPEPYGPESFFDEDDKIERDWFDDLNLDDLDDYKDDTKIYDFFNKYIEHVYND